MWIALEIVRKSVQSGWAGMSECTSSICCQSDSRNLVVKLEHIGDAITPGITQRIYYIYTQSSHTAYGWSSMAFHRQTSSHFTDYESGLRWVAWKCRTGKWWAEEITGVKNAGLEIDGTKNRRKCRDGKRKIGKWWTWKWRDCTTAWTSLPVTRRRANFWTQSDHFDDNDQQRQQQQAQQDASTTSSTTNDLSLAQA